MVAELEVLEELRGRGAPMGEVALSLAAGSVLRGRLSPERASQSSGFTAAELRALIGAGRADVVDPSILVSIVVPALNEEENLAELWTRVHPVLDAVGGGELVIVDDGSVDGTWSETVRLGASDPRVRGVRLSRNFGHQAALTAGMAEARGRTVCFMDADLQDPPELVEQLLAQWRAGHQVVYAVRRSRQEGLLKRASYRAFYRLYRRLANIDVPLDSGDFALIDRAVVDDLLALPEHNRFLRGLRSWVGYSQVGVDYDRDARNAGAPKYTTRRLFRLAFDGLLSFSAVPLRLASYLGIVVALAGGLYIGVAVAFRLWFGGVPAGWTSIIAVILTVGGIQLLVLGVLGEYVARVYDETKGRPNYLVAEISDPSSRRA
ncbi:MAG: glycosyltransferase family 2 protein [Acidimicrobiales bacterium]